MLNKKNPNVDVKKIGSEFKLLGLVFSLALSFMLIVSSTIKVSKTKKLTFNVDDDTEVIDNTEQKKEPPKVIPPTITIVQNTVETPATIEDTELDEEEPIKDPEPPGDGGKKDPEPEFEKIYEKVEEMPKFRGGDEKLTEFLEENVKYPDAEKANGVTGEVRVYFVVDGNGEVTDINTDGNQSNPPPSKALKLAAEEAIKKMMGKKLWIPGKQGNKYVKVRCMIPVSFQLEDEEDDY